jgi:hypothetical protein
MEGGLRFGLGFSSGMLVETTFLSLAIWRCCGPFYLINMLLTIFAYMKYTQRVSAARMDIVR